jgi:hypothetical protein
LEEKKVGYDKNYWECLYIGILIVKRLAGKWRCIGYDLPTFCTTEGNFIWAVQAKDNKEIKE